MLFKNVLKLFQCYACLKQCSHFILCYVSTYAYKLSCSVLALRADPMQNIISQLLVKADKWFIHEKILTGVWTIDRPMMNVRHVDYRGEPKGSKYRCHFAQAHHVTLPSRGSKITSECHLLDSSHAHIWLFILVYLYCDITVLWRNSWDFDVYYTIRSIG